MTNIVILISGRGSNMQAIVEAAIPEARIAAVIANRADASGLAWAAQRGIATAVLDHKAFDGRDAFDAALAELIDSHAPDLVVLAGFMRILTPGFVNHYAGRLVNIHPSLLPAFTGLHTHERALAEGVKFAGCTVHFVTAELDHGPIIAQAVVPVLEDDTADTLAARILKEEHRLYPEAVRLFAQGRLAIDQGRVRVAKA
ncbi:phosphoribosylglycinamide formyltransferase [Chitiniphilus eburneus]|uniref:Phosphoribosylglycinamide formyltransferase n=1 Tax=Chitiniphilus eburneus TaxID=2571148 RepID=A0A4U0QD96_9NEIS|nr:phosphoribosylglycinamide formyltransferase [Chitiniphilus eburneus]TJZ79120.1 phosphoribosylglycinamide formyltransferase [Chitiniphilus eburneus]